MRALALLVVSILLLACAAPSPEAHPATPAIAAASPEAAPRKEQTPPVSAPVRPERVSTGKPDRSCATDADCTVKDVGNCCGYYPACVNKDSPTDPEGVRAKCAKKGMASVCGFNEITGCRCVRNQCVGDQEPVGGWTDDPPAPPPADR